MPDLLFKHDILLAEVDPIRNCFCIDFLRASVFNRINYKFVILSRIADFEKCVIFPIKILPMRSVPDVSFGIGPFARYLMPICPFANIPVCPGKTFKPPISLENKFLRMQSTGPSTLRRVTSIHLSAV